MRLDGPRAERDVPEPRERRRPAMRLSGLRARLLGLVVLGLLPAFALVAYLNLEEQAERRQQAYEDALRVARLAVGEHARLVENTHHLLLGMSRAPAARGGSPEACATTLRETLARFPAAANLTVVAADGVVRCTAVPAPAPVSFADRPWFRRVAETGQLTVAAVPRARITGIPVAIVALPVPDDYGGLEVVLTATLRLDWVRPFADDAGLPAGSELLLVDGTGAVVAGHPAAGPRGGRERIEDSLRTAVFAAATGTAEHRGADGVERLHAFARIGPAGPPAGLAVVVGIPDAHAFSAAREQFVRNVWLLGLAAAASLGVAWAAGSALILNGVRALTAATRRLGTGDFTTRAALGHRHGELGDLAEAFDDMAAALEQRDAVIAADTAERQSMAARLQWAAIAEGSTDAIVAIDMARVIVSWNRAAEALYGYTAAEAVGRPASTLTPPADHPALEHVLGRVLDGERVADVETVGLCKDGRPVDVAVTYSPILDGDGSVQGISAIARDITERRRARARLRVLAAALEAAASGIAITDHRGVIEWVNPAFEALTGYTRDEVVGRTPRLLKSGVHGPDLYAALWRTIRAGRVWRGEMVNRRRDGSLYTEEQTITPVRHEGEVTHFVAVKQDVTERRRAEEALRRSEEHFRALIENALDMIFVVGADGAVRYASPSVERVLGYGPEALIGRSAFALIHPDDVASVGALFASGVGTPGAMAAAEYRVVHRDGSVRTLEAVGRNALEDPGVAGVVINARDVTERKRGEEAHQRLQRQLAQAEKLGAMGTLLAGVAHELNNPLAVVIGQSALLADTAAGPGAARAQKIEAAAQRCTRIVKNFLSLARQRAPERERLHVGQLVHDTLEMMAYALRVDDVEVVVDVAESVPPLFADPHQLQQVLVNLVTNAHHAMRAVTGPRRLTITARHHPGAARVSLAVADTGPGIAPEAAARLFEPFFTTKPVGTGTGLGLSISRGLVEAHGGRITVDGAPGGGALFTVELPVERPGAEPAPAAAGDAPPVAARRLLVVDDDGDVRDVLTELLRNDGHQVDTAADGVEALTRLAAGGYDAIVSDIRMPGLDGPGLYRAVTERHPELRERFIFVTGDALTTTTADFLSATGAPTFPKPFSVEAMRSALAEVGAAA
jgi:PAS domain S-box-containing protein